MGGPGYGSTRPAPSRPTKGSSFGKSGNLPGAHRAQHPVQEDRADMEEYLSTSSTGWRSRPPRREPRRHPQKMATIWEENFAKPDRASGGAGEDPPHQQRRTPRPTAISSASTNKSASGSSWSRPTASTWRSPATGPSGSRCLQQDGAGLRDRSSAIWTRGDRRLTTTFSPVEGDHPRRAGRHRPPLRGDLAVGTRPWR